MYRQHRHIRRRSAVSLASSPPGLPNQKSVHTAAVAWQVIGELLHLCFVGHTTAHRSLLIQTYWQSHLNLAFWGHVTMTGEDALQLFAGQQLAAPAAPAAECARPTSTGMSYLQHLDPSAWYTHDML